MANDVTLDGVVIEFKSESDSLNNSLDKLANILDKLASKTQTTSEKTKKYVSIMSKLGSAVKGLGITALLSKLTDVIGKSVNVSSSYIESLNLFKVSLGENAKAADEFVQKFSKTLSLDPSNVYTYIGTFNSLVSGFGIAKDEAYIMSKNLTQLSYDMASFYNLPIDQAMKKLKSGISGEIEPMRAIGVALDQATLQQTAYTLGIKKNISEMTRAQKTQLLYYQIMSKTVNAQTDMGRTLLSPANALRTIKEQFTLLSRAVGNIFIPIIMAAIPYVSLLTQFLTELANKIAAFFGFKITDYVNTDVSDVTTGIEDIGSSADETSKKLKRMLRDFDELHVIEFDTGNKKDNGVGTSGGRLDIPTLEYDALANVQTKKLDEIKAKFELIKDVVIAIGTGILAWKVSSTILDFFQKIGAFKDLDKAGIVFGLGLSISGIFLQYMGTERLLEGDINIFSILETLLGTAGGALGIVSIINSTETGRTIPLKNKAKIGFGIMFLLQGLQVGIEGIKTDNLGQQILGAIEGGIGLGMLKAGKDGAEFSIKSSLLFTIALFEVEMAFSILKWWGSYFNSIKNALYGDKKELDLGEFINVSFTSIGVGLNKALEGVFGTDFLQPVIDWVANQLWTSDFFLVFSNAMLIGENIVEGMLNGISSAITGIYDWLMDTIFDPIIMAIEDLFEINSPSKVFFRIGEYLIQGLLEGILNLITNVEDTFDLVWETIKGVFNSVKSWFVQKFTDAWNGIKNIFTPENMKNFFDKAWGKIKEVFSKVKDWFKEKFTNAWTAIKEVFSLSTVGKFFGKVWDKVKEKFTNIGQKVGNAIGGAFKKAVNTVMSTIENVLNTPIRAINSLLDVINTVPGVSIGKLSEFSLPRMYEDGGFPTIGDLFIANESGAEYVGSMNGKPAVANNDQIVEGIREGTYQAMRQALSEKTFSPIVEVRIGNNKVYSGYASKKKSDNNMYGVDIG